MILQKRTKVIRVTEEMMMGDLSTEIGDSSSSRSPTSESI